LDLDFFQEMDLVRRLAVATLVGLLVGIERGWRERKAHGGTRTAGIRTFTLIGFLGGVIGLIARSLEDKVGGAIVVGIVFMTFAVLFAAFRMRENIDDKNFGFTTVVAAMITFVLGVYAVLGDQNIAAAAGVAVMVMLAAREQLHGILEKVTWNELRAAIILLAMTFLALPFIPDQNYGPYGGINPRQVWLLAVILAAVSFLGYIAVKIMGPRQGTLIASAAGGLVSSTAVTLAAGQRAAVDKNGQRFHAAGVAIATAVSLTRTLVLIFFLNRAVAAFAAAPLIAGALVGAVVAVLLTRAENSRRFNTKITLKNPFSLQETLILAAMIGVVTFATEAAAAWFGTAGGVATAMISGAVDVDAATISLSRLGSLSPMIAALGILAAVGTNNLFKYAIGSARGGAKFSAYLLIAIGLPIAAVAATAGGVVLFSEAGK
jgi:uncharacterized membrane protein (DUF4010 family)